MSCDGALGRGGVVMKTAMIFVLISIKALRTHLSIERDRSEDPLSAQIRASDPSTSQILPRRRGILRLRRGHTFMIISQSGLSLEALPT